MKKAMLVVLLLSSLTAEVSLAAEVCTNREGSFSYDSATTVGSSVVIINPRLVLADGSAAGIQASEGSTVYPDQLGTKFCKAIGMRSGRITENRFENFKNPNELMAVLGDNGQLLGVKRSDGSRLIQVVTCFK